MYKYIYYDWIGERNVCREKTTCSVLEYVDVSAVNTEPFRTNSIVLYTQLIQNNSVLI